MKDLTSGVELVAISQLKECPKRVTLHSRGMLDALITAAESHFDLIPPITAAEVDGTLYIIDGHARVEACKAAGLQEIRAIVKRAKDVKDICIEHVVSNTRGTLNPFKLYDMTVFLGDRAKDLVSMLGLDHIGKIGSLNEQARSVLSEFLENVAYRVGEVYVPEYLITKASKLPQEAQVDALTEMIDVINTQKTFYWPTPSMLDTLFNHYRKDAPREPVIFERKPLGQVTGMSEENGDEDSGADPSPQLKRIDSETIDRAKALIGNAPGYGFMRDDHGDIYLVNMKKQSFSPLKETDSILTVKDDSGKLSYILPPKYSDFLGLDIDPTVYAYTFDSLQPLEKFVAKVAQKFEEAERKKRGVKLLVIATERVW